MIILDGKAVSLKIQSELRQKVAMLPEVPTLVILQVGDNPSSNTYIKMKHRFGEKIGVPVHVYKYEENISVETLLEVINFSNQDDTIGGIIVQLPLPKHIDKKILIDAVAPDKDVDGLSLINAGKLIKNDPTAKPPATPSGIIRLLKHYNIEIAGKNVVVIGRSQLTGLSSALLFIQENATVTVTHSHTQNLKEITSKADILIAASGQPHMITAEYIKTGAVVVDVGTTPVETEQGIKLRGDVDFDDVSQKVSAISPVPGGVGPMTVASLFLNLLRVY